MPARTLPNVGLKAFYDLGENGWKDDMDANLLALSVLTQGGVVSMTNATPGAPAEGAAYIFGSGHPDHANKIAVYDNSTWKYFTPLEGWQLYDRATDLFRLYTGASWIALNVAPAIDTDGTLAANSDTLVPSQKAVKTYVDAAVTGLLDWKGAIDASANPNYPAASKGDSYSISVAGKIGGGSGSDVDVGDVIVATADNAGGTQAAVGASWVILEHNLVSALSGATASTTEVLQGTDNTKLVTPDSLAALWEKGADIASAGTITVGEGGYFHVTGTTTITDIDPGTDKAGRMMWLVFDGALTLTHNGTTLILPTSANIATSAGDAALFVSEGSDVVRCLSYKKADGTALAGGGGGGGGGSSAPNVQTVTSSATVTPTFSNDVVEVTSQAAALALADPTGTAVNGWNMTVRIKDNGTARAITYGSKFRAIGGTLPASTVPGVWLYLGMSYNQGDDKWDVVVYEGGAAPATRFGEWTELTVNTSKNIYSSTKYGCGTISVAAGDMIEIEAYLKKTTSQSSELLIGDATEYISLIYQTDGNVVLSKYEGSYSAMVAAGGNANANFNGWTTLKLQVMVIATNDFRAHGTADLRWVGTGTTSGINLIGAAINIGVDTSDATKAKVFYRKIAA